LAGQADAEMGKLKKVMTADLSRLNQLIHEKQLPAIGIKKTKAD